MSKQVIATFPLKGASTAKTSPTFRSVGFTGDACREGTKVFEDALGEAEEIELTDEFYETEERNEYLQEGGDGDGDDS